MTIVPVHIRSLFENKPPKNGKYYLVAIDGRGGSGKSTLSNYLLELLTDFSLICGDDYFEPIVHPIAWGGYNEERFYSDVIHPLKNDLSTVNYRPYDWENQPHIQNRRVEIGKGVIIDRCYSFSFDLNYDLKIWVETPRGITLTRGISRSSMPKDRAEKVWREVWKPMEDRYIKEVNPTKTADIVVDGTKEFKSQLSV